MKAGSMAWGIWCVWLRYLDVFRKSLVFGLVTTLVEPLLYLAAFGYGLGAMIGIVEVDGVQVEYLPFVLAGIGAQTLLFQAFYEASYGSFVRMYYQRIFQAISMTPITLSEVLWGELFWDASRATVASLVVLLIGMVMGHFNPLGVVVAIPVVFAGGMLFAGVGMLVAARSPSIDAISYPAYLLIFPMFLFSGIFFPLGNLPPLFRAIAWVFPLTPIVSLLRTLTLGFPLVAAAPFLIAAWAVVVVLVARRAMLGRLVK